MSDTVTPDKYLVQKLHRSFGPSTCRHCGKSYTLPGEHKCSPTYTELQANVDKGKRLLERAMKHLLSRKLLCEALQAEVKRLEGIISKVHERSYPGLAVKEGKLLNEIYKMTWEGE